jgi:hypothetical protein
MENYSDTVYIVCYDRLVSLGTNRFTLTMDQASRIIAQWGSDLIAPERIACAAWKKAVGARLAARTTALKLVRERLVIEVEDEVWRNNLYSLRPQILRNLEKALGPGIVGNISFEVRPRRIEPQRETKPAPDADVEAGLDIADPGMRRIYRMSRQRAC